MTINTRFEKHPIEETSANGEARQYIVWHDNGRRGQNGYSEEIGDLSDIINRYENAGIIVYSIDLVR